MKNRLHRFIVPIITILIAAVITTSCSGPHVIGYSIDPLEGLPIKYATPVLVRNFADKRPVRERFSSDETEDFDFYSLDKDFKIPVDKSITKSFQIELANTGFEVADPGNFIIGEKPHIRIKGYILHFNVIRQKLPDTPQHGKVTLWKRQQFTILISIKIKVINAKARKLIMERTYTSNDSFAMRSEMIDIKAYTEGKPIEKSKWQIAGDDYAVQLLNDHLKRVLVQARQDIVKMLSPVELQLSE